MLVYKYISKADDDYFDNQAPCIVFPTIWVIIVMMMKMKITRHLVLFFQHFERMRLLVGHIYALQAVDVPEISAICYRTSSWEISRTKKVDSKAEIVSIVRTRLTLEGRTWWYVFPRLQSLPPIIDHIIDKKSRLYLWYHKMMVPVLGSLWTHQGK